MAIKVKRGKEIIGCHVERKGFKYVGTISRHGKVNLTYSFSTTHGVVKVHSDLETVVKKVRKLFPGVKFNRMVYGGR